MKPHAKADRFLFIDACEHGCGKTKIGVDTGERSETRWVLLRFENDIKRGEVAEGGGRIEILNKRFLLHALEDKAIEESRAVQMPLLLLLLIPRIACMQLKTNEPKQGRTQRALKEGASSAPKCRSSSN